MAKEATQTQIAEEKANRQMPKSRRYVGSRETTAYILFDISQSLNLSSKDAYFVTDVLVVALKWQTIINAIASVWDIVNDFFLAALVDRTNTRFGKFKPYLLFLAIPCTMLSVLYWLLPLLFPGTGANHLGKFIAYFTLKTSSIE